MVTPPFAYTNVNEPDMVTNPWNQHHYGGHPKEALWVWRPTGWDAAGFKNKPLLVHIHGGLGNSAGNVSLGIGAGGHEDVLHTTHGWPVVSIEYPTVSDNSDAKLEECHSKLWPYALHSVARAIAYLKAGSAPDAQNHGLAEDLWGVDAAGDVNTVNPTMIVLSGFSYGATLAFLLAHVPAAVLDIPRALPLARTPTGYGTDARVRAVVGLDGQIDWTQFSFNPSTTIGTYRDNVHQVFHRRDDKMVWGDTYLSPGVITKEAPVVPLRWKEDASPYHWALRGYPEALGTAVMGKWDKAIHTDPDQLSLTHADWSPGSQRLEEDLGKAWYDPHHNWQAKPYETLLNSLGIENAILWGSSATNPDGKNLDTYGFDTFVVDWLVNTLGIV